MAELNYLKELTLNFNLRKPTSKSYMAKLYDVFSSSGGGRK